MTAKKRKKKIAPSKTKPRSTRNMQEFIKFQISKTQSYETLVLDSLRVLIDRAFERDEALPTISEIAAHLDITCDCVRKIMLRLQSRNIVINVSRNPKKKLFVLNDPEYIGDSA